MSSATDIVAELERVFGEGNLLAQTCADGIATVWAGPDNVRPVLAHLRDKVERPFRMLYDLSAVDERNRQCRAPEPAGDFTVFYMLLSLDRGEFFRVNLPLAGLGSVETVIDLWPNANWYERELWDMFGIDVKGHPHLCRILMPPWWQGHPLRKDHPARATELEPFTLTPEKQAEYERQLTFRPEEWGLPPATEDSEFMYLNFGPHHPSTHGVFRLVLQVREERIVEAIPDIGYHHRGAEKMGERQTWHTYIPYTDRVDYLAGVLNNFPYVLAVEKLAGIDVPDRARVMRILLAELYRVCNHLVFYGTFTQDLGAMSPVFYMFTDRERAFDVAEAVTGARMHPNFFRIGGLAADLPYGWEPLFRNFIAYMRKRLDEYDKLMLRNRILKGRCVGVGRFSTEQAVAWGATGPMLRSTGLAFDARKAMPYGLYEQFDFDVPVGRQGDVYDRAVVHVEEMRQSLRIMEQCVNNMPPGECKSRHPLATPPLRERMLKDIETLIHHFLHVSWGPVIPPGQAQGTIESAKGMYSYHLVSDGGTHSYRTRIRTASFPHLQMVPLMSRGHVIADLVAILGGVDFVLSDVDR